MKTKQNKLWFRNEFYFFSQIQEVEQEKKIIQKLCSYFVVNKLLYRNGDRIQKISRYTTDHVDCL